jgi:hypothetical protein
MGKWRITGFLAAALGVMLVLAACGDDDESPEETLCNEIDRLETEIADLEAMDLTTTPIEDIRDQIGEVVDAAGAVQEARIGVGESRVEAIGDAVSALGDTLTSLDGGSSIEEIANAVASAAQGIDDAAADLGREVNCP